MSKLAQAQTNTPIKAGIRGLTAPPHKVGLSASRLTEITKAVQHFIATEQLAGAVTIIARRGKIAHFEASGMMDLEANKTMQKDTIFRIYSMTKPVAAVAVMMLYEAGKLELDTPVSQYLPAFSEMQVAATPDAEAVELVNAKRQITVRDLLRHTAGLPGANRYLTGQTAVDKCYRAAGLHLLHECDLEEMVRRLGTIPLLYQPGSTWHYSIAADVLGRLIEVISGQAFDVFLAEHIFQPLAMPDTAFYVPSEKHDRFAKLYGPQPTGELQTINAPQGGTGNYAATSFLEAPKFLSAGGGLVSTATDFMRFCLMLAGQGTLAGTRLLKAASVAQITSNQLPQNLVPLDKSPVERYAGLGFGLGVSVRVQQTNWIPASRVGEYGWIGGTSTEFWVSPQDELITITLAQHMPFSKLSQVVKSLVYAAITEH